MILLGDSHPKKHANTSNEFMKDLRLLETPWEVCAHPL